MTRVRLATIAFATLLTLVAAPAAAQGKGGGDKVATPTEAQVQLYQKAIEAYGAEEFEDAIELLRSSLALGELNLVYLNLGRAHFRNGDCVEAAEAYDKALTAPAVAEPPREAIDAKVEEYRKELTSCPGIIVMTCDPGDMKVTMDNRPPVPCTEAIKVPPGEHVLTATNGKVTAQARVVVEASKRHSVELVAANVSEPPPPTETPEAPSSPLTTLGIVTGGVGVAALLTGVVLDVTLLDDAIESYEMAILDFDAQKEMESREDAEDLQTVVLGTYIAGGVLTLAGGTLMTLGLLSSEEPAEPGEPTSRVAPWVVPGGAGVSVGGTW